MSAIINFKRGATFSYGCMVQLPSGTWSAASKLRDAKGNVYTLDITLTPPVAPSTQHTLLISKAATVTTTWPIGRLQGDIVFTDTSTPAVVLATTDFEVDVARSESL